MEKLMDLYVFFQIKISFASACGKNKKTKEKITYKFGIMERKIMKDKLQQKILSKH